MTYIKSNDDINESMKNKIVLLRILIIMIYYNYQNLIL